MDTQSKVKYILTLDRSDGKFEVSYHDRVEGKDIIEVVSQLPLVIARLMKSEYEKELLRLADDDIPF
jgi:hypothetical protein